MSVTSIVFPFKRIVAGIAATASFGTSHLALPLIALGTLGTIGATSAAAAPDYFDCAADMINVGISEADAIASCASARYPGRLGACVVDVSDSTPIEADQALVVCGRSRRPLEVADCTINIHDAYFESASLVALENCGRSIIPADYGTCVVDIADATEASADVALTQCIRAGFQPWRIRPSEVF